jgi:transketolase
VALHLTRPPVEIPDRKALNIASHMEAAKGAYIIKDYDKSRPKKGVVIIRGTSCTNSLMKILPRFNVENLNVKIIAAISWELFQRQPTSYRISIISDQEWMDAMVITNGAIRLMHKWIANRVVEKYSMSPDFDNCWRTGGSLDEIVAESKLDPSSLWEGINQFAEEREQRLSSVRDSIPV